MGIINRWKKTYGYSQPIKYIFDRLSKGKGDINAQFEKAILGGDDAVKRYGVYQGGWSFEDKAVVIQLQAADIWAYENLRYMRDWYLPQNKKPQRKSYVMLKKRPVTVRYHNRTSLIEVVRRMRERDQQIEEFYSSIEEDK